MAHRGRQRRVFLIAPREEHNLRNAGDFGKLITVYSRGHRPNLSSLSAEVQYARRVLQKEAYNPSEDYVCVIGAPLLTTMFFCAVMADYHTTEIKVLVFVAQEQRYQPRDIYFGEEIKDEENSNTPQ